MNKIIKFFIIAFSIVLIFLALVICGMFEPKQDSIPINSSKMVLVRLPSGWYNFYYIRNPHENTAYIFNIDTNKIEEAVYWDRFLTQDEMDLIYNAGSDSTLSDSARSDTLFLIYEKLNAALIYGNRYEK